MMLLRPPGVYAPQQDTALLIEAMVEAAIPADARVLDVGTGTGRIALAAAVLGAAQVTAVDVSRRAVWATRLNTRVRREPVRVVHGDLFEPVRGQEYDVVLANPPYLPTGTGPPGRHSRARCVDAGRDGRQVVDRVIEEVARVTAPRATLLLVHSGLCGTAWTLQVLREGGFKAAVAARRTVAFGPRLRARAGWLRAQGLIEEGRREEELVVIRADRTED